jgi:predicted esterase YcpF (UPF0227 family)
VLALIQDSRNKPNERERLLAILKAVAPQWFEAAKRKQSDPAGDRVRAILGARLKDLDASKGASQASAATSSPQAAAPKSGGTAKGAANQLTPQQQALLQKRAQEKVEAVRKLAAAQLSAYRAKQGGAAPKAAAASANASAPASTPKATLTPEIRAKVTANVVAAHKRAQAAVAAQRSPGAAIAGGYLGGYIIKKLPLTPQIRAKVTPHVVAAHKRAQAAVAAQRSTGAAQPQAAAASIAGGYLGGYVIKKLPLIPQIRAKVIPHVVAAHKRAQAAMAAQRSTGAAQPQAAAASIAGGYLGGYIVKKLPLTPQIRAKVIPHVVAAHKRAQAAVAAQRSTGAAQPQAAAASIAGGYLGGYIIKKLPLTPQIRAKVTPHVVAAHKRAQAAIATQRSKTVPAQSAIAIAGSYLPGGVGGYVVRAPNSQQLAAIRARAAKLAEEIRRRKLPGGYLAVGVATPTGPVSPVVRAKVTPFVVAAHQRAQAHVAAIRAQQAVAARQRATANRGASKQQGAQKQTTEATDDKEPGDGATPNEPAEKVTASVDVQARAGETGTESEPPQETKPEETEAEAVQADDGAGRQAGAKQSETANAETSNTTSSGKRPKPPAARKRRRGPGDR